MIKPVILSFFTSIFSFFEARISLLSQAMTFWGLWRLFEALQSSFFGMKHAYKKSPVGFFSESTKVKIGKFYPWFSIIFIFASIVSTDKSAPHSHSTKYPPL